ncbi:MAG: GntR family transcriptional regulator [Ruminococcaceae bacterium]|nr:GntR family transcriptional regulator [Oscillospiraceae bacterium]
MYSLDILSRTPVYEQIIKQTEDFISKGILNPGDKIPSVRNLSVMLSVNPNTIQKAFSELDTRGLIFSVPGKGCFITENAHEIVNSSKRKKLVELDSQISELMYAGIKKEEIIDLIEKIYKGGKTNDQN